MTTYMKGSFDDATPAFHRAASAATDAAMRVCELVGSYTDEEIADAICDAMMAVMYEHGVIWDSPPDGTNPFNIEAMQDAVFVARQMI